MARKAKKESTSGEQLQLIDITPENLKAIKPIAQKYSAMVKRRLTVTAEETTLKAQLLELITDAHLTRLPDGTIKFKCDGMLITVKPRDELIQVREDGDSD